MSSIDIRVVCDHLAIGLSMKPMAQIKRNVEEYKRVTIKEDVENLENTCFITEIKYLFWLANMILV